MLDAPASYMVNTATLNGLPHATPSSKGVPSKGIIGVFDNLQ